MDFPVTIMDSVDPNLSRDLGAPGAGESFFAVRDPSGEPRRGLEKLGALEGGLYVNGDGLKLLAARLRADGDAVTYVTLTDSTHTDLSKQGEESLLDALVPSTQS